MWPFVMLDRQARGEWRRPLRLPAAAPLAADLRKTEKPVFGKYLELN